MSETLSRHACKIVPALRAKIPRTSFLQGQFFGTSSSLRNEGRAARLQALQLSDHDPFPRLKSGSGGLSCCDFITKFRALQPSQNAPESDVHLCGRIQRIRFAGSKLVFLDILQADSTVQILCSFKDVGHELAKATLKDFFNAFDRGDIVEAVGRPQRTPSGELSLRLQQLPRLLAPCLHPMPDVLVDHETRMRKRHVDLRINTRLRSIVKARAAILDHIRRFLISDGHIEVQTPIMADGAGGAIARSFNTRATEFPDRNINLRIAPELWLKRLIVGGMDRVFEIGPSFRNEGIDLTHNPEFTTCEFYRCFTDLDKLISMTEELMGSLANHIQSLKSRDHMDIDLPGNQFGGPYKRLDFIPEIESRARCKLPDLNEAQSADKIKALLTERDIGFNDNNTLPQLLDRLSAHYLEPECEEPTWIINHPACLSPLAKSFRHPSNDQLVSARGELFVDGKEIINTYEEENSPVQQREKFVQQLKFRNDENEAHVDESYIEALEWGMPPTGGWGCGIDRLVMLFTGASRISDVLTFGNLRNVVSLRNSGTPDLAVKDAH